MPLSNRATGQIVPVNLPLRREKQRRYTLLNLRRTWKRHVQDTYSIFISTFFAALVEAGGTLACRHRRYTVEPSASFCAVVTCEPMRNVRNLATTPIHCVIAAFVAPADRRRGLHAINSASRNSPLHAVYLICNARLSTMPFVAAPAVSATDRIFGAL